jgi:hypothetical protein
MVWLRPDGDGPDLALTTEVFMSHAYFPHDFAAAQGWFTTQGLPTVQRYYPDARLDQYPLPYAPELTVDAITAVPPHPHTVYMLTTGLHGAEGFIGAAVMRLFINQFLPQLDHRTTGLLLVQPINPWGMAQGRRVNGHNVDLNRNFFLLNVPDRYAAAINPDYDRLNGLLNPSRPVKNVAWETAVFSLNVTRTLITVGAEGLRAGTLLGQYRQPQGIYYGGREPEAETELISRLLAAQFDRYTKVILLDIHSGYGPRYQMSLVTSPREPATAAALAGRLAYPLVVKTVPGEFYAIQGDMVDFAYQLAATAYPEKAFWGAAFEFGTLGRSLPAGLRSLLALILENQLHWHGSATAVRPAVARRFQALFYPREARWQAKALGDAGQAFAGILSANRND